ncbi:ATP synthase subunit I [Thiosocius teredinicola]|uniref:ATP synthase subunit I n=1 Tax=Thiosocius teredinicola TaxID=1973002 RepID=UPI000990ED06
MQQMQNLDAHRARRILVAQAVATIIVTLVGLLFGLRAGFFALLGGATATIANALFAYWVFGRYRAGEPGKLVSQFYGGEFIKLAFIAAVFAVVIIWFDPLSPLALFGAFFVVQVLPPLLANRIAG